MSSLAQMVIRLVAEARQFKADLSDAAQHTQKVSADMVQSTTKVEKAVTALGDQMGVSRDLSDKAGAAVSGMGAGSTVAAAGVGVLAAGLAAYALIAKQAADESKRQADALTLTGNAAGLVSGQLNDMAREASAQINGQVGNMRSTMESLVASGRVSQTSLADVAKGVELVARFSGQSREAVAKDFAGMASDVTAWAAKHNEQYHYLTLDQYKYIESLQKAGDVQGAMVANMAALNKSVGGDLTKNLGYLQTAWAGVANWASKAWDNMLNLGREKSTTEKLKNVQDQIFELVNKKNPNRGTDNRDKQVAALEGLRDNLQKEVDAERKAANEKEAIAAKSEAAIKKYRDDQKSKGPKADPNREIDAEIAALKAGEAAKAEVVKQGLDTIASERKRGVISESDALQQTVALQLQALGDKRATVEAELELSKKKTNSQKEQATLQGQIAALEAQQRTIAIKYGNDYFEMLTKGNLAAAEAHYKYIDSLEKGLAKMQQDAAAQDEHNARLGLSKQAIAALDAEKLRSQAVTLELMAIKQLDKNLDEEQYRLYKAQAKALRDLADAKQTGAAKEAGIEAEKAIAEEAKRTAETVERTLTDALMRGFESGKGFARNLYDATVNLFKTLVLRPVIQGVVGGVLGLPGAAMAGGSGSAGAGGLGGLFNMGKSVYNMATDPNGWFGNFGGSMGGSVADFGTSLVDKGFTQLGTSIESFGLDISSASGTINMLGDGLGYLNSIVSASKGQWGTALGSAIGTYFGGPIGAFIGSKIGGWIDKSFGGATKPSIEGGYSTMGDPGTNGRSYTVGADGNYYGGALDKGAKALVTGTAGDYNAIVKSTGYKAGDFTAQAFMGFDGNGGSKGSQNALDYVASLNGKQIYNRYSDLGTNSAGTTDANMSDASKEASTKSILSALEATDLGPQLNAYLDKVKINGASLAEVTASLGDVTSYIAFSNAVKSLPFDYLKTASVEATKALAEAAGGMDQFGAALGTYFDLFGTEAEKQAAQVGSLSSQFDALGVTMPAATDGLREWYKSEVARLGAMDLGVEANAKAYAGALKLASGVDALAKAEEQAATTRQSWQDQLNVLTGKTTDTALQMQRDLASTTDESTQALIRAVYAEKDRQKAIAESATAMQKMATDQAAAAQKSADAYKSALSAQQSYYASLTSAGDAVRNLLAGLKTGVNAGTSPQSRLDAARAQYLQDLSAARGGDFAAYNRVATTAQTYIGAGSDMYASSAEQKAILAQVQSELQNLPAVSQYDANLAQLKAIEAAIKDGATNTVGAIQAQQFDTLAAINSMTATLSSSFGSIDANANGMLTFDELKAGLSVGDTLTQQLINAIDSNGDGQISKLEIIAANTYGLDTLARINASVNSINWTDKAAAVAQFAPIAQANGWTLQQIAAATGYNLSDIQTLFSGSSLSTGMGARGLGTGKASGTAATPIEVSSGPSDASWSGNYSGLSDSKAQAINTAIQSLDWNDKNAAATDIWNKAYYLGWTEQDIATETGYNLSDIEALFKNAGLPAFATGGTHIGGLRIVGENGPELEATGPSRIWNASDTANMLRGGGGDNQALINEVRELRKEVAKAKESDTPIHVTVMTHDGKKLAEQVISTIKERSRNREVVIYANGVGAAAR